MRATTGRQSDKLIYSRKKSHTYIKRVQTKHGKTSMWQGSMYQIQQICWLVRTTTDIHTDTYTVAKGPNLKTKKLRVIIMYKQII